MSEEIYNSKTKVDNVDLNITIVVKSESERSEEQKQAIQELRETLFDFEVSANLL